MPVSCCQGKSQRSGLHRGTEVGLAAMRGTLLRIDREQTSPLYLTVALSYSESNQNLQTVSYIGAPNVSSISFS